MSHYNVIKVKFDVKYVQKKLYLFILHKFRV
jgi:hypothetical protein